jgi:hypothetical protein
MDVDKIIKIAKYFNLPERYSLTGSKDISKIKDESMQKMLEFYINLYDELLIKKDLKYKTNDLEKKGLLLKGYKIMSKFAFNITKAFIKRTNTKNLF